jgi:hydroxymethylpyrimidine pyrophosphatase-like HAD family hydrolase
LFSFYNKEEIEMAKTLSVLLDDGEHVQIRIKETVKKARKRGPDIGTFTRLDERMLCEIFKGKSLVQFWVSTGDGSYVFHSDVFFFEQRNGSVSSAKTSIQDEARHSGRRNQSKILVA